MAKEVGRSVRFTTRVSAFGNNTGIEVPAARLDELGGGKRPAVIVDLNGYVFRTTLGMLSGASMVSVSAAIRKETGLKGGDTVAVTLTLTDEPRPVDIPDELAAAFKENPMARSFFDGLSNSLQRYHTDNIRAAKAADTRQRRIDKAITLFLAGKKR